MTSDLRPTGNLAGKESLPILQVPATIDSNGNKPPKRYCRDCRLATWVAQIDNEVAFCDVTEPARGFLTESTCEACKLYQPRGDEERVVVASL